jgi:hypothetical protein
VSQLGSFVNDLLCGSAIQLIADREQASCGAKRVDDRPQAPTEFETRADMVSLADGADRVEACLRNTLAARIFSGSLSPVWPRNGPNTSGKRFRGMVRASRASRQPKQFDTGNWQPRFMRLSFGLKGGALPKS